MGDRPAYRAIPDQRPVRPPVTGPRDELDRTARQVRLPGRFVHRLAEATAMHGLGRVYGADCGQVLLGSEGALLTTDDVDCPRCNGAPGGRP